jgi:DNA-binding NarL/FixJ family response regulator
MNPARLVLVEDDPQTRARFVDMIRSEAALALAAECKNATEALAYLKDHPADVLLTDLGLPDRSGVEVIRFCAQRWPNCDIMVITVFGDEAHVLESIEAGATGYVLKDASSGELVEHVRALQLGGAPISPMIARHLLRRHKESTRETSGQFDAQERDRAESLPTGGMSARSAAKDLLSHREVEVLSFIAKGFSFAEIANFMQISVHTVMTHVKRIYRKLAVHSRGEAVFEAQQLGLLR